MKYLRNIIIRFLSTMLSWVDNDQLKVSNDFLTDAPKIGNLRQGGTYQMPHSALSVANAVLDLALEHKNPMTPLKLQKFIYICHGFNLALVEGPLIKEAVFAWDWGPVIPAIYHEFKIFGKDPIEGYAKEPEKGKMREIPPPQDEITRAVLKGVWGLYGKMDGYQLANLTHKPGTPWEQTWKGGKGKDYIIENDLIKAYYTEMLAPVRENKD